MKWLQSVVANHPRSIALLIYSGVALLYAVLTDGVIRDDAYIFFVYARNLAGTGLLAFNPGEVTFGTTSIAWTGLLTAGAFLGFSVIGVAKVLGALLGAGGIVLFVDWLCLKIDRPFSIGAVVFAALLPNIGADRMVEGMETGLVCFLIGLFLFRTTWRHRSWLQGAVLGLLALTRPELSLLALGAVAIILWKDGIAASAKCAVTALVVVGWWPMWLYSRTGGFLPPTRIGKLSVFLPQNLGVTLPQFTQMGWLDRFVLGTRAFIDYAVSGISEMSGVGILAAATLAGMWVYFRSGFSKSWPVLIAPIALWVSVLMYIWSFPLFQLRYFLWGVPFLAASLLLVIQKTYPHRAVRYLPHALAALCLLGQIRALPHRIHATMGQQLRRDAGMEVALRTPSNARVALEPIGEIGYYANRYIVDMGGITDLRIQPYIGNGFADAPVMWQCLVDNRADYLVTYDTDDGLGSVVKAYPDRFQLVSFVPPQQSTGVRYRLLRIIRPT